MIREGPHFPFSSVTHLLFLVHGMCSATQTFTKIHPQHDPDYKYCKPLIPPLPRLASPEDPRVQRNGQGWRTGWIISSGPQNSPTRSMLSSHFANGKIEVQRKVSKVTQLISITIRIFPRCDLKSCSSFALPLPIQLWPNHFTYLGLSFSIYKVRTS